MHLEKLDFSGCSLTSSPSCLRLSQLPALTELDLSHNQLHTVPESISEWGRMQRLYLHNNLLETVPWGLGALKELQVLTLDNNPFTQLHPDLRRLIKPGNHRTLWTYLRQCHDNVSTEKQRVKLITIGAGEAVSSPHHRDPFPFSSTALALPLQGENDFVEVD